MLLRLSTEEKVLGIGALAVLVSCFLPWYSVTLNYNQQMTSESAFTGDLGVIGFVIFILVILSLIFMMADYLHFRMPKFGYKKEQILLFLMGESAFLILLTIAVYTKRSLDYTNAGLRFGIYLSLIGTFVGAFAAYAQNQKLLKKSTQEFFGQSDSASGDFADDINPPAESLEPDGKTEEKNEKKHAAKNEQKSFFYEKPEKGTGNEEAYFQNENQEEADRSQREETAEEEIIEELDQTAEIPQDLDKFLEEDMSEKPFEQSSYFMKEAGVAKSPKIKVDIDSIKLVEKSTEDTESENADKSENEKMSFYDDL